MSKNIAELTYATIKVEPDFKVLNRYLFGDLTEKQLKNEIKLYKAQGSVLHIGFLTQDEITAFVSNLDILLDKYPLKGHETNLEYIVIYLYGYLHPRLTAYSLPNKSTTNSAKQLEDLINFVLQHKDKNCSLSLYNTPTKARQSKHSKNKIRDNMSAPTKYFNVNDPEVISWLFNMVLEKAYSCSLPLRLGSQVLSATVSSDVQTRQQVFDLHAPNEAFETSRIDSLVIDSIIDMCVPLLNYLNNEDTELKNTTAGQASSDQLSFLIEVLILTQFYDNKSSFTYKFGKSKPTVADKNYLKTTFKNRLKVISS